MVVTGVFVSLAISSLRDCALAGLDGVGDQHLIIRDHHEAAAEEAEVVVDAISELGHGVEPA